MTMTSREIAELAKKRIDYNRETGIFTWAESGRGIRMSATAGCADVHGYWKIKLGRKAYRAHRLAWLIVYGEWPSSDLDHINGDRLDNRLENLREATHSLNMQNKRSAMKNNKSSGLLGVTWNKQHKKWQSKIMVNKVFHHVGYFNCPDEAHAAYLQKKRALHAGCTI